MRERVRAAVAGRNRGTRVVSAFASTCSRAPVRDHQDALVLKFIKDSGGVIDLALRSPDDNQAVQTDAVTLSTIYDQFKFRLSGPLRP